MSLHCIFFCLLLVISCLGASKTDVSSSSSSGIPKNPLIAEIERDLDSVCGWIQEYYVRRKFPKVCEDPVDGCRSIVSSPTAECLPDYFTPTVVPGCPSGSAYVDTNSSVMMTIEEWQSSRWSEVLCRMDGIGNRLIEVGKNTTNITHVFAGFPAGALRMWPAMDWTLNETASSSSSSSSSSGSSSSSSVSFGPSSSSDENQTCPGYDPRESSWYALASTGPLDLVVVLDVSEVMCDNRRSAKAAEAVRAVIRMLSTGVNFVNIVLFDEKHTFFLPSFASQTVEGKPVLRKLSAEVGEVIRKELLEIKPTCTKANASGSENSAIFVQAVEQAEEILKYSRKVGNATTSYSAFCRRAIVVLSGNSAPEVNVTPEASTTSSSEEDDVSGISVFAFTYGLNEEVKKLHKQLTCNNSGLHAVMWDNVTSHVNEVFKITQYFAAGMLESNTVYTVASEHDTMLRNTMIASRSCRWLISSPPKLLAVVGVAVPMYHVTESLSQEEYDELEAEIGTCPPFELETYGVEELRGDARCTSAVDLFLITFSIIIGFFVVVITSVWISCSMLPAKTLEKFFPCCVTQKKNILQV